MKYGHLLITLFLFLFIACEQTEREQAQQQEYETQLQQQIIETTEPFKSDLTDLLNLYFDLKDQLVLDNPDETGEIAENLIQSAEQVDTAGLNEETVLVWSAFSDKLISNGKQLIAESGLDDQRYYFEELSDAMIQIVDTFRPADFEIYVQSCPMVRDGSADWLSREEQIKNPYHGDRMLNCGEVLRRI